MAEDSGDRQDAHKADQGSAPAPEDVGIWLRCRQCRGASPKRLGSTVPVLREYQCPTCTFWVSHAALHGRYGALGDGAFDTESIRLQHVLYSISTGAAPNGPVVAFRCFDGTLVVTNRLQLHGEIPQALLGLLPDNAVLVPVRDLPIGIYTPAHSR